MPQKKKAPLIKKRSLAVMLMVVSVIAASYAAYSYLASKSNRIPAPLPSSFRFETWMFFVPAGAERFRFLNITSLARFQGLFNDRVILSLPSVHLNITIDQVSYGLEVETSSNMVVNIMSMNATTANKISELLAESQVLSIAYRNVTIYMVETPPNSTSSTGWISVFNGTVIYAEGADLAFQAVKLVIDASARNFFSDDMSKIGYLLTRGDKMPIAFSFFKFDDNALNIGWAMLSLSGSSEITEREAFYFAYKDDVTDKYQSVVQYFLSQSKHVYISDNFILGDFIYSSPDTNTLRTLIMGM